MSEINERNLAFAYDPMLREVGEYFVTKGEASTSMVQKVFSIGYNRAGRIMDQLEALGVVGEAKGSMPRKVLVADKTALNELLYMKYIASTQLRLGYYPLESYTDKEHYQFKNEGESDSFEYVTNRADSLREVMDNIVRFYIGSNRDALLFEGYRVSIDEEDDSAWLIFSFLADKNSTVLSSEQIQQLKEGKLEGWVTDVEFDVYYEDGKLLKRGDFEASEFKKYE